jgi:hypothetical protein
VNATEISYTNFLQLMKIFDSADEMIVFGHNGDALGMDGKID